MVVPPHNEESEAALLGAMLYAADEAVPIARTRVAAEDFHRPRHGHVFEAICVVHEADRKVDPVTVSEELRRRSLPEPQEGWKRWLLQVQTSCPAAANSPRYADDVALAARQRRLIGGLTQAVDAAYKGELGVVLDLARGVLDETKETRRGLRLLSLDELLALPPPTWLIDGHLQVGTLGLLYGPWGVGKSFVAVSWACCVASGRSWFGQPVKQGPVVYIAAEGASGIGLRIDAWRKRCGVDRLPIWVAPEAVNLLREPDVGWLLHALATLPVPPVLVVVDTLARSMVGGDENSAKDMGLAVEAMSRISRSTGATVLGVHHSGRDGRDERGHSSLPGAVETKVVVRQQDDGLITVSCDKQKDSAKFASWSFRLEVEGESCVLERVAIPLPALSEREMALLGLVSGVGDTESSRYTALEKAIELPRKSFARCLNALVERGFVVKTDDGGYRRTIEGEKALGVGGVNEVSCAGDTSGFGGVSGVTPGDSPRRGVPADTNDTDPVPVEELQRMFDAVIEPEGEA